MVTNGAPADNRHLVKLASVHVYNIYIISMVFKLINTSTTLYVAAFTVCFFNNTQYRAQCNRKLLYLASIYGNNVFFLYGNNRARELCNKVGWVYLFSSTPIYLFFSFLSFRICELCFYFFFFFNDDLIVKIHLQP